MIPSSSGLGWGSQEQDPHVDTIDLTLSSPEPEQRPRMPPQQQRLPSYFKHEPRSNFGGSTRVKDERGPQGSRLRGSQSHARPVNPQHLAQIIDTSNPRAVKSVLLELCRVSPALSGAVARGLAPHSTFAQRIIRQDQQTLRASTSRPVKQEKSYEDDVYERAKRRLAAQTSMTKSSQNRGQSQSTFQGAHGARPTGSQSVPRIKRERHFDMADSDSDLDQYIPHEFPLSAQRAKTDRLPLPYTSNSNTVNRTTKPFSLAERLAHVHEGSGTRTATKTCRQCHNLVEDEVGLCSYHPGGPEVTAAGAVICAACNEPWVDEGCMVGMHDTQGDVELDPLKRNQPNRSQSPSKKPRIA
jgi:hypothetical protein